MGIGRWLPWPRPPVIFLRPVLGALTRMRTTAAVELALLKMVEQFQFTDHPSVHKEDRQAMRSSTAATELIHHRDGSHQMELGRSPFAKREIQHDNQNERAPN